MRKPVLTILMLSMLVPVASGASLTIAVASNFFTVAQALGEQFSEISGHSVRFAQGSTGQHYAQIRQGAPYDIFLAADVERPRLLEQEGFGVPGTRSTYAIGQLVLWVPGASEQQPARKQLHDLQLSRVAVANARLAPYGAAAETALERLNLLADYQARLVRGNNIAQAYQFVATANAPGGFVALSQLIGRPHPPATVWQVPQRLYEPIEQQLILLSDTEAAHQFREFLLSPGAVQVIRAAGYTAPAS